MDPILFLIAIDFLKFIGADIDCSSQMSVVGTRLERKYLL